MSSVSAARTVARWGTGLRYDDIPEVVRRTAIRHVLDGIGCAVAALDDDVPALRVARGMGGPAEASVLGTGERMGAPAAALANGVLVHTLDFDDTHAGGLVHPTAPVLPAVLAVGEQIGAAGRDVLAAVVVGYETICRLGAAAPHGFHARGLHATSVCGVFAAALSAARLYGLDEDAATHALGIAGSQAGGLLAFLGTGASTKQLHPGFAAHAGVLAARLAVAGATGPESVLDGERGLYRVLLDRDGVDVCRRLGEQWETTRVTVKPYPACQLLHAPLDAARSAAVSIDHIDAVVVDLHPDAVPIVCGPGRDRPDTAYAAKFSLPWSVAAMLADGEVTTHTYRDLDRPELAALASRIRYRAAGFEGPAADQPGRLCIRLRDGTEVEAHVPHSRGGPDDPHLDEMVREKALANGLTPDAVAALEHLADHDRITSVLQEVKP
ncbi:MmgE/PrpD family protein [Nocardia transvalensis]|uniref:MmgE/PrpD family protein n=1 Tax=Nocardia transvalensis TaxID=37333 RepID=UPI0018956FF1|nr:MmgE/PrpD family protein [Nocardia transvalensis]MBF6331155.1 MmgE/PrpD family protein [Nocardia transvalensis]